MRCQIHVYHNEDARFTPYQDDHRLVATVSIWLEAPEETPPETLAGWAFRIFNADLDDLETGRATPEGEIAFLSACLYRLLALRSLSVGDLVRVTADSQIWWLACDPFGWRHVTEPFFIDGVTLTAEKIYRHLQDQHDRR